MQVGILKTDGGPHSATKWAAFTAGRIIDIASSASGEQELEARRLELKIIDILEKHHTIVQDAERAKIASGTHDYGDLIVSEHTDLDGVVKDICDVGKETKWAEHFSKDEVVNYIRHIVGVDFATNMQIERFWHADRTGDPAAVAYKKIFHGGAQ